MTKLERKIADLHREALMYSKFADRAKVQEDSDLFKKKYEEIVQHRDALIRQAPRAVRVRWDKRPLGPLL